MWRATRIPRTFPSNVVAHCQCVARRIAPSLRGTASMQNLRSAVVALAAFRHIGALKKIRPTILISKYKNFLTGVVRLLELVFMTGPGTTCSGS
jgi:hypothetical protein